ncbi:MAG: hypothetical protein KBA26_01665 [Candidatus Delongbacteria bacterium]|nr:hypothetical protein [Candidatus Delongbacteria bacterium]
MIKRLLLILMGSQALLGAQTLVSEADSILYRFYPERYTTTYYLTSNPALLSEDLEDSGLKLSSWFNRSEGQFKPYLEPGDVVFVQPSASGKKSIDSNRVFKGSFGFQKQMRKDWHWVSTQYMPFGMPFLLGDSATGATHYNGIALDARYAQRVTSRWYAGAEIDYYVDEGVKKVSPKPISDHNAIRFHLGTAWIAAPRITLGLSGAYRRYNEEIDYDRDKTNPYVSMIYKFRGYDFARVFNKDDETRYVKDDHFMGRLSMHYRHSPRSGCLLWGELAHQQNVSRENPSIPRNEGTWTNRMGQVAFQGYHPISVRWMASLSYGFERHHQESDHSIYDLIISQAIVMNHSLRSGLRFDAARTLKTNLELKLGFGSIEVLDNFCDVEWNSDQTVIGGMVGAEWIPHSRILMRFSAGWESLGNSSDYTIPVLHSDLSTQRLNDIYYYLAESSQWMLTGTIEYRSARWGTFRLNVGYRSQTVKDDDFFTDCHRRNLNLQLDYLVQVF